MYTKGDLLGWLSNNPKRNPFILLTVQQWLPSCWRDWDARSCWAHKVGCLLSKWVPNAYKVPGELRVFSAHGKNKTSGVWHQREMAAAVIGRLLKRVPGKAPPTHLNPLWNHPHRDTMSPKLILDPSNWQLSPTHCTSLIEKSSWDFEKVCAQPFIQQVVQDQIEQNSSLQSFLVLVIAFVRWNGFWAQVRNTIWAWIRLQILYDISAKEISSIITQPGLARLTWVTRSNT